MDGRKRRRMVRRSRKARKNFLILLTVVLITGIGTIAIHCGTLRQSIKQTEKKPNIWLIKSKN